MRVVAILALVGVTGVGGWFLPDLLSPATAVADTPVQVSPGRQREEVQRIMREELAVADELWPEGLTKMKAIARGDAPEDFWTAWETHVHAGDRLQRFETGGGSDRLVGDAEDEFRSTYLEVLAIARRHGVDTSAAERKID